MRLTNKRLVINDRMTPRQRVAVMPVSVLRAIGSVSNDHQVKAAASECELEIVPVLERFSKDGPVSANGRARVAQVTASRAIDGKKLAAARNEIGTAVVATIRAMRNATDPYLRIAANEWLIWSETERRRVMPKGRGRPRKEAIR